ncbi:hypothetical protein NEUTE1DRAFT_137375 [Neurospora tetrasperma FGSC 2508]|uniref:Uncharacterized protein n=1 Tax=Neurospora tetrasperma (strain FGSC 2508 / ATCC MYA-4615 / P0657) TaxID=510951 RepID=F8ML84_NEUT8|nr:uncharacterized protein NEUTE1DRAFT_137375 [Neurospora tetrasperma FGSC 2508]EGO57559.1 hypothetical protein NEUTE1DRAFT_137375 [Neurospora tetrasperma FGSC 2508]
MGIPIRMDIDDPSPRCTVPQEFRVCHQNNEHGEGGIVEAGGDQGKSDVCGFALTFQAADPTKWRLGGLAAWPTKSQQIRGTSRYRSHLVYRNLAGHTVQHETDLSTWKTKMGS